MSSFKNDGASFKERISKSNSLRISLMPLVSSGDWECPKCHSKNVGLAKASKKSAKMMCNDCGFKGSAMDF